MKTSQVQKSPLLLIGMMIWMLALTLAPLASAEASRWPANSELLVPEAELTRGVVLSIPKASLSNPSYLNYWDGSEVANEIPFVIGVQVLSATGFDEDELNDMNNSSAGSKLYVTLASLAQASLLWQDDQFALISVMGGVTIFEDQEAIVDDGTSANGTVPSRISLRPVARPERVVQPSNAPSSVGQRPTARPADLVTSQRPAANQMSRFSDAWIKAGVPESALRDTLNFARQNSSRITNKRYLVIADFTAHSNTKRLFLLDTSTGRVERYYTSHGIGSDPGHTGYAKKFSNRLHSNVTPPGFHLTKPHKSKKHGVSIILHGLEKENSMSAERGILIHKADYTTESYIKRIKRAGRSHGCLAVEPKVMDSFLQRVSDGVLVYHYTGI